jgi:glycosyltransferase involved in cell wall biosynthesis
MNKNEYVLCFPSWYPSEIDNFNGDFNQRTIEALSLNNHQVIIYLIADKNWKELKIQRSEQLFITTIIVYYPKTKFKILNLFFYLYFYFKIISKEVRNRGLPLYLHTYVFFPAGLISYYFSKKLKLKNVLTEHWSSLYPENEYSLTKSSLFFRKICKKILNSFDLILPVSTSLKVAIDYWAPKVDKIIIPNVVDTNFFKLKQTNKFKEFTFLHISSMECHKNPEGILEAFETSCIANKSINLKLVGPIRKHLKEIVEKSIILKEKVEFIGEVSNHEVAKIMQKSHCLVMNSFYESLPCVILEALCCGLPVVSTNVGGVHELIDQNNGILFDDEDLKDALDSMYNNYYKYDINLISKTAIQKFSYETIAFQTLHVLKAHKIFNNI